MFILGLAVVVGFIILPIIMLFIVKSFGKSVGKHNERQERARIFREKRAEAKENKDHKLVKKLDADFRAKELEIFSA